ncbi:MAG: LysR substrate-binding domain-containing protein [Pseudomonadota bacterium]
MASPLDSDQLRTFIAIAETGSFTRAAEVVHKTQSAVSMQMKRLEDRVGASLFTREGRAVRLSDKGERLADYARQILSLNAEALASLSDDGLDGHVRLGTPDDFADRFLPEILALFARSYPKVEVTVVCEPTPTLAERIRNHDLDLAIITHVDGKGPVEVIRKEPLHWVASHRCTCPLRQDPIPLALGRPTCAWRQAAERGLNELGRSYRVLYSSWNSMAVAAAVSAGLAVSVLPESAIRADMKVLGPSDGFPLLPSCKIALLRDYARESKLVVTLADHIIQSLNGRVTLDAAE